MLAWIPIRWRITLFHVATLLAIAGLLVLGMFAVFGIAAENFVQAEARARSVEAARLVEQEGTLSETDLATLNRDNVFIIAIDAEGRVVRQIGSGYPVGSEVPPAFWQTVATTNQPSSTGARNVWDRWDDRANFVHTEPVGPNRDGIAYLAAGVNYDTVGQSQFELVTFAFLGFGIAAFILAVAGSFFLVRYSLAPVTAIANAAAAISEEDLSRRLPVRSGRGDELDRLARTFNELLARLQAAFADREAALEYQRRFVADASHELRTPLTSILGYARLLHRWGESRPEASAEALEHLSREAERMQRLIEGLLVLARGDEASGLVLQPTDLGPLVLAVTDEAITLGDALNLVVTGDGPWVANLDPDAVRQVLAIVLDNARRHAAGAAVTVSLSTREGEVVLAIQDEGPGIPPGHLPHLFERFYRGDTSRAGRGSGLGLAIARDLVTRQGGAIEVTSIQGQGTTFTIRFPALGPAVPPSAVAG
jgi:two-component system OmpR family sensor kinase